jgi:predicted Zn-dependent protease
VKGGPADAAGLRSGDVVRKVNETPVADTESLHAQEDQLDRHALKVYEVERAGETLAVPVTPDAACRYRVYLSGAQVVNAFANGKDVMVTRGMAGFAGTDDELALVLSHEMAHNVMRHIDKRKQNAGAGALGDLLIALLTRGQYYGSAMSAAAASAYSQEFEAEADYVGLYIMASAGFPIDDAPQFWRRMAAMNPASIKGSHSASHPSTAYRMIALENAVQEIHAKQAAGEPLRPNLKDGQVAPATAR